jgi:RimJ/RimL family protein N-acetyltransferase
METDRLLLRCLDLSDVTDRYLRWLGTPATTRYLEVRFKKHTHRDIEQFIVDANTSDHVLLLGIFLRHHCYADDHLGNIRLGPISWIHRRSEISLIIGEQTHWGKGYATEVIRRVTDFAHSELKLIKLVARIYAGNIPSRRAFLRAGYVEEARLSKHFTTEQGREDALVLTHFTTACV